MKETNHNLKLNDAIVRNKIRKHEREIDTLKQQQDTLNKELTKLNKQHNTDFQYLIKQKELESRFEIDIALQT